MNEQDLPFLNALRKAVLTGDDELVHGDRLAAERQLAEVFNVGRRCVRLALDQLEHEGLVIRRQGQGTFLKNAPAPTNSLAHSLASQTSPSEIMEARLELEPAIAKMAAMRATPADIEQMRKLVERTATAETGHVYERWDSALHAKIAGSIHNKLFESFYDTVAAVRVDQKWSMVRARTWTPERQAELAVEHTTIVDAIAARDPYEAQEAMRAHLERVSRRLASA